MRPEIRVRAARAPATDARPTRDVSKKYTAASVARMYTDSVAPVER